MSLREATLTYVRENDHVSFAELTRHLEALGFEVRGEHKIRPGSQENIYFWIGMSEEFAEVIDDLRGSGGGPIVFEQSSAITYLIDGESPNLPIAKRGGYKTPHWLPVVLRPREKVGR